MPYRILVVIAVFIGYASALAQLSVGIWVDVSLNNLRSNLTASIGNMTLVDELVSTWSLLASASYIMIAAGALHVVGCTIIVIVACRKSKEAKGKRTMYSSNTIGGILLLAAGICAAIYLSKLDKSLWTESQVQLLSTYSIAIIVLAFIYNAVIIIFTFTMCCVLCGLACCTCCGLCVIEKGDQSGDRVTYTSASTEAA